jgi:hypothetical protein
MAHWRRRSVPDGRGGDDRGPGLCRRRARAGIAHHGQVGARAIEHRQFDFWAGHWDVFVPSGKKAGETRGERIADGCALLGQRTGNGGVTGKSLNICDASDRRWHPTRVDDSGTVLMPTGGLVDTSMG